MSALRVAHFVHSFLPVTQNWIYNQLSFNRDCESAVFCQFRENANQFPFERIYAARGTPTVRGWLHSQLARVRGRYTIAASHRRALQLFTPNIIHAHFAFEAWRNFALTRHCSAPLITTFYGLDVNKLWRRRAWKKRYPILFRYGAAFVVEGEHMGESLAAMGCPREKIHVIRIGVDIERIQRALTARESGKIRILFAGLSREKKGAEFAARAFARAAARNPAIELHLVGQGRYRRHAEKILNDAAVRTRAVLHGALNVDSYLSLLGQSDVLLAPSVTAHDGDTEGGAPVTVIEAQAAGIPVVGTFHCDIPSIVKHNETGLLCAERDDQALSAHLLALCDNRELRVRMAAAARRNAAAAHDIRRQVEKITALYRASICHRNSTGRQDGWLGTPKESQHV